MVRKILDGLPRGRALDAACGTGRHAQYLASLGYPRHRRGRLPDMLAVAKAKLPDAEFRDGDLHHLPVPDQQVDVVVCALALEHVLGLARVLAGFARVLRPGGHLVISDSRTDRPLVMALSGGDFGYLPHRLHLASDYLAAALPLGFEVRGCEEPRLPYPAIDPEATPPSARPITHPTSGRCGPGAQLRSMPPTAMTRF